MRLYDVVTSKGRQMSQIPPSAPGSGLHPAPRRGRRGLAEGLRRAQAGALFLPQGRHAGCTKEAIAFNGLRAEFAAADTAILGVSAER